MDIKELWEQGDGQETTGLAHKRKKKVHVLGKGKSKRKAH